jgi:hypothetical protein
LFIAACGGDDNCGGAVSDYAKPAQGQFISSTLETIRFDNKYFGVSTSLTTTSLAYEGV